MSTSGSARLFYFLVGSILSQFAWGQYVVQSTGAVTGSCGIAGGQTTFSITAPGTMTLPAGPNNLVVIGGTQPGVSWPTTQSTTVGAPIPGPLPWIVNQVPQPGTPVTLGLSIYPANAGIATGTGFGGVVSCGHTGTSTGAFSATTPQSASAEPSAAYSVSYAGGVIGGSCSTTNISGAINGTVFVPPPQGENLVAYIAINGTPYETDFNTMNPASITSLQTFSYTLPNTTIPYSITGTVFPARNGAPVGTGVTLTYYCQASGLTTSPPQSVTAPVSSTSVPTLSMLGLVLMIGAILAAAGRKLFGRS